MIDHPYQPGGPFGRCAEPGCNRKKASHERPGAPTTKPPEPAPPPRKVTPGNGYGTSIIQEAPPKIVRVPYAVPETEPILPRGGELAELIEPVTPLVLVQKRVGVGQPGEKVPVSWPPGWPLPAIGHSVVYGQGTHARVREILFDVDRNQITLVCD
jgi:hypothetical protein